MMRFPEVFRIDGDAGESGAFLIRIKGSAALRVIASNGGGWEHVSVSLRTRTPTWAEMSAVKSLFWEPEDCVVQYHPPASLYVDCHQHCLHMWRPLDVWVPVPPTWMVGPATPRVSDEDGADGC